MVPLGTMSKIERPRVNQKLIKLTKNILDFPVSATFNDSLSELLKRYEKLVEKKKGGSK